LRVARGKSSEFPLRIGEVGPSLNERPSGSGRKFCERAFDDPQAVIRELELADDFRIERLTV